MDSSNSSESQASVHTNQPKQTETITCMDRDTYNAAAAGRIEFFKNIINDEPLGLLLTPNKNTILHIYITALSSGSNSTTPNAGSESTETLNAGSESTETLNAGTESTTLIGRLGSTTSLLRQANAKCETPLHIAVGSESTTTLNAGAESTTNFVEEILKKCPSLLWQANAKCETPLHIAARYGHDGIVEVLIEYCAQTRAARAQTRHDQDLEEGIEPVKELLRMTNKEKDTALHEAIRNNHLEVVKLLISKDPDFSYSANDAGETPLYIAAERRFEDVLFEILDKCKSPMHGGPLGRTALHAAVMLRFPSFYEDDTTGMVKKILENIEGISREVDNNGWTPLHLAAHRYRSGLIVKLLLDKDREVAYMKDTKGRTPLHITADRGNSWPMKVIVEMCPDCCELVDNRGWNVLHFAIKGCRWWALEDIINIIIKNLSFNNLLNEKNADGDTPLHFYATTSSESLLALKKLVSHPRLDKMAFNKQHLNAEEIYSTVKRSYEEMREIQKALGYELPQRVITYEDETTSLQLEDIKKEDWKSRLSMLQKATEVHLVVAALIATVTFAACITMPGGFVGGEGSHSGSALLRRSVAFKAFVITDTISMVLSSSAVFIHLLMPFLFNEGINYETRHTKLVVLAFILILGAMVAMGLAFVTGTYAVLMPSHDLAITNCIVGLTFFAILFTVFGKTFYHILRTIIQLFLF